jgi:putative transposase
LRLCRYIERNPLRAGLVRKAENWLWSSLRRRQNGAETLSLPPVPWPVDWPELVQRTQAPAVEAAIRMCIQRGQPYGGPIWTKRTAARLGLASTLRPRGRPPKVRERST